MAAKSPDKEMDPGEQLALDHANLTAIATQTAAWATVNPIQNMSAVVQLGTQLDSLMSRTSEYLRVGELADFSVARALGESLSSLARLSAPFNAISVVDQYSLVGSAAESIRAVGSVTASLSRALYPDIAAGVLGLGTIESDYNSLLRQSDYHFAHAVASPYIATAESAFSLGTLLTPIVGSAVPETLLAGVSLDSVRYLQENVGSLSVALTETWNAIGVQDYSYASASVATLRSPAFEVYADIQTVGALTLIESRQPGSNESLETWLDERVDDFESRLARLDTNLVAPYTGAIAAIRNGDPDWRRHSMTSLRELASHALRQLAPDVEVMEQATEDDLHDGRPTRRARLNYVFRGTFGPELADFYEADMKASMRLFDFLNSGTHRLDSRATPRQLHYIRGRVVGLISSMLDASGI